MPRVTQQQLDRLQDAPIGFDADHFFEKLPPNPLPEKPHRLRFVTYAQFALIAGVRVATIKAACRKRLTDIRAGAAHIDLHHDVARAYLERRGVRSPPEEPDDAVVSPWYADRTVAQQQLRWFFSQSGGDLGERSAWESLCFAAIVGGGINGAATEPFNGQSSTRTPDMWRLAAAETYGRIADALGHLTAQQQAVLERTYSLRKPNTQIRGMLSAHGHAELEPVVTYLHRIGQADFRADGAGTEIAAVIAAAAALLAAALDAYELARHLVPSKLPADAGPSKKTREPAVLIPKGASGASKRKLIDLPRGTAAA